MNMAPNVGPIRGHPSSSATCEYMQHAQADAKGTILTDHACAHYLPASRKASSQMRETQGTHLHATDDHARDHFPGVGHNSILSSVHVQSSHSRNASVHHAQFLQPLDTCMQLQAFTSQLAPVLTGICHCYTKIGLLICRPMSHSAWVTQDKALGTREI